MSGPEGLAGLPREMVRKPHEWRVEIVPVGEMGQYPTTLRVRLVDADTGRQIGAREVPWEWFRDCAHGQITISIAEGVYQ